MLENPLAISAVLLAVIFVAVRLTERYPWAEKLSAVLMILFLAAAASNTGLIPKESELYSELIEFTVPFAVCLVLFRVNLRDLKDAGAPMLVAAALAILGTVAGVLCAGLVLAPWIEDILGEASWKIAGPYTGTYIGGSINFFSLWEGLEIGEPDLFAAANAVDNLTLFPLFAIWIVVPNLLRNRYPVAKLWRSAETSETEAPSARKGEEVRFVLGDVVALCLLAVAIMAVSGWIQLTLIEPVAPEVPRILVVTTLALICGHLGPVRRLTGAWELSQLAFFVFFAAVGSLIDFYKAVVLSPILFVYVMIIIAVHMVTIYGLGRLLRLDLGVLTMTSAATKAGPPMVLALVEQRKDWKHLALPGVVVALAGYAVGNYVGFGVAYLMRSMIG